MQKFRPRFPVSQRPVMTRGYHVYIVRNLQTLKSFKVYSENHLAQMIANEQINDDTHDICLGVSADFGYSYSRSEKELLQREYEAELEAAE